ncbi:3-phosphoshikimate 1-carboxyvinyltransferase [soil metagenome]
MIALVSPGRISGTVTAPASKSAMQRACALALLNNGQTIIHNPGTSNDDKAALGIIQALGAALKAGGDSIIINSKGIVDGRGTISCGESGLSFRMFAPIAALSKHEIILTGEGSLLKRTMHFFDEVFPALSVSTKTMNGFLPITIRGPLLPADINIDGSMSSQYLTGLLFAFARSAKYPVVITVHNLKSKPYIDLSLQLLEIFGYKLRHEDHKRFFIQPPAIIQKNIFYQTEADWSAAAFLLVAGAIAGNIKVKGLDLFSTQADRAVMDVLLQTGAAITAEGSCVHVNDQQSLRPFEFDATDSPDLFPPLVALAAYCKGTSVIYGVSRLAGKESDRAATLMDVFGKMGIDILLDDDNMIIRGGTGVHSAKLSSHHDHRIAMASAIAALNADGNIEIENAEAINKSYPEFYHQLQMMGAAVSLS